MITELREYKADSNFSKPSTGFVDLASYNNLEQSMYAEKNVISYFMRETVKCTWFSQIPVQLQAEEENVDFGQEFSVKVSMDGDYLMNTWLRVTLPANSIYFTSEYTDPTGGGQETLKWTPNFMHNLVEHCKLKVNGTIVDEFYSEHLDFYAAFMVPKNSRIGYNRMIGNFSNPHLGLAGVNVCGVQAGFQYIKLNYDQELFLPLPFFFSKNTGLSLPVATLPYNDITIEFKLRNWNELCASISKDGTIKPVTMRQLEYSLTGSDTNPPMLENVQVWGNYAMVTENERKKIGCKTRDMLIEQNHQIGGSYGSAQLKVGSINDETNVDIRIAGAIKGLFFGARNTKGSTEIPYRSNYTTSSPSASDVTVCNINVNALQKCGELHHSVRLPEANVSGDYGINSTDKIDIKNGTLAKFVKQGNNLYTKSGVVIGEFFQTLSDTQIEFQSNINIALSDGDGIYFSNANSMAPPTSIDVNRSNNITNNFAGLLWDKQPTDPIGSAKIVYENDLRMNMESMYYSLIQPYYHADNIPDSSAMKGIISMSDPNEVGGEPALSVGYHMYSYALNLKNIDPCGGTNFANLNNVSLVFTPSHSAVECSKNNQGPWHVFVSAITQNIMRISNGAMEFPIS